VRNEKQITRRLQTLHSAVDVLTALAAEMPQAAVLIGQASRQVTAVREQYEAQCESLDELARMERKPPQRVSMRSRKRVTFTTTTTDRTQPSAPLDSMHRTHDVGDYDMEQEQEMRDRFGDDIAK
jgi:hypothetical protein